MKSADLQILWGYNCWANERIFAAAAGLSAAQWAEPIHSGHGDLFDTLLHVLDTEWGWRIQCQEGIGTPVLTRSDIPDLAALIQRSQIEGAAMAAYIASLSDEQLASQHVYNKVENPHSRVLWHILMHVINHGTYHRGEMAAALTRFGHSPGEIDLSLYVPREF